MTLKSFSPILLAGLGVGCSSEFQPPTRIKAGGVPVRVESPGYAAPCWADLDGDGKKDLLVGQFKAGRSASTRISARASSRPGSGSGRRRAVAEVPGVW